MVYQQAGLAILFSNVLTFVNLSKCLNLFMIIYLLGLFQVVILYYNVQVSNRIKYVIINIVRIKVAVKLYLRLTLFFFS